VATKKRTTTPPTSLGDIQVDVTNRLGALTPATTTGIRALDTLLGGGLRAGTHVVLSGVPGVGKTALSLLIAYVAARARAAVVFASGVLDDTEVIARLTARALHREYNNVDVTYGEIWSGQAMQDAMLRAPISSCINNVIKKVGSQLFLHSARPMEPTGELLAKASFLWNRHDRVVVVVDGIEAFSASGSGNSRTAVGANSSFDGRLSQVAYELTSLASQGCAVLSTCQLANAPLVIPAASFAAELRAVRETGPRRSGSPALDRRPVDLVVTKNRTGPTATIPLAYFTAASVFEERGSD
jgi:replicative DNA helicase